MFTTFEIQIERYVHSRVARRSKIAYVNNVVQRNQNVFEISEYLLQIKNRKYRQILSKFRLSSHQLAIEKGRHINIERNQRKCPFCTSDIEDEFHFILICPEYIDLRKTYIHKYSYTRPSMYKLTILLTSTKSKLLKNLAIYLLEAFKVRTEAINIVNTV